MSRKKKVQAQFSLGALQTVTLDKLRFFNPKSPFRQAVNEAKRIVDRTGWTPPVHFIKTAEFENGLLLLLFNNTNYANVGDATGLRGSSTAGNFYVSLHTADPGTAGNQTTSETSYTSYARVAVPRDNTGWTVSSNVVDPAANISFPACTGGTATITHGAIGTATSGNGHRLYNGTVTPNISVSSGVTPVLTTASSLTET